MEYLQYIAQAIKEEYPTLSFKPYYKWNTFNTLVGLLGYTQELAFRFKPYYKWNTFNTINEEITRLSSKEF